MTSESLSAAEARALALRAQGFDNGHRRAAPTWAALQRATQRMQLLQIDSVNVLVRSHYLPLFARTGAYNMATLDSRSLAATRRAFFECWAHEASLVPMDMHPLMRWRMERARRGSGTYKGMDAFGRENRSYLNEVERFVRDNGPTRAAEVPGAGKGSGGWWGWSTGKLAVETLFDQGRLTTACRQGFERIYDVPERVIPAATLALPTPAERDVFRTLMIRAGQSLGIATEQDLRDYFRLPVAEARTGLHDAVEDGALVPVHVEGWRHGAYMARDAAHTGPSGGTALLSPFDPLVWNRPRAERVFGFHYRIELYTPEHKRKHGYYVLPFLHGQHMAARVCLKTDRATATLRVNRAHLEPGRDAAETADALHAELELMRGWLGLQHLHIGRMGNLARALQASRRKAAAL